MRNPTWNICLLAGVMVAGMGIDRSMAAADQAAANRVIVQSIQESRSADLQATKKNFMSSSQMTVTLLVLGPDAASASSYDVHLDAAKDDQGDNLTPTHSVFSHTHKIDEMDRDQLASDGSAGFRAQTELKDAKRSATKLAELKGMVKMLAGGKEQVVEVPALVSQAGKDLADPALKAADVVIHVKTAKAGSDSVELVNSGTLGNIRKIEIVDEAGKDLVSGNSTFGMGKNQQASYDLSAPLSPKAVLRVTVVAGQHEIAVPFDFKDIALP